MKVVEVFGPTIQGEGPYAGRATHFVRFGGCDFRCSWCDSMHAVEPALVRQAEDLTPGQTAQRLAALEPAPMLVISGGNPALQRLDKFIDLVRSRYEVLAVETQGTRWRSWLNRTDSLVVSPKPPSSGMATTENMMRFGRFMGLSARHPARVLKVVVFDKEDLLWVQRWALSPVYSQVPLYLSVGTDPHDTAAALGARYGWLCERVLATPALHKVVVLPQLHVLAWGHMVGV